MGRLLSTSTAPPLSLSISGDQTVGEYLGLIPDSADETESCPYSDFDIKVHHGENQIRGQWLGGSLGVATGGALIIADAGTGIGALLGASVLGAIFGIFGGYCGEIAGIMLDLVKTRREPAAPLPLLAPQPMLGIYEVFSKAVTSPPVTKAKIWRDFSSLARSSREEAGDVRPVYVSSLWNLARVNLNSAIATGLKLVDTLEQKKDFLHKKIDRTVNRHLYDMRKPDTLNLLIGTTIDGLDDIKKQSRELNDISFIQSTLDWLQELIDKDSIPDKGIEACHSAIYSLSSYEAVRGNERLRHSILVSAQSDLKSIQSLIDNAKQRRELLQSIITELMLAIDEEARDWVETSMSEWQHEADRCMLFDQERVILQIKPITDSLVTCGLLRMKATQDHLSQLLKQLADMPDQELTFQNADSPLKAGAWVSFSSSLPFSALYTYNSFITPNPFHQARPSSFPVRYATLHLKSKRYEQTLHWVPWCWVEQRPVHQIFPKPVQTVSAGWHPSSAA